MSHPSVAPEPVFLDRLDMATVRSMHQYRGDVFGSYPRPRPIDPVDGVARPRRHVWAAVAFSDNKPLLKVLLDRVPDNLLREILLRPVQALTEVLQEVGQFHPAVFCYTSCFVPKASRHGFRQLLLPFHLLATLSLLFVLPSNLGISPATLLEPRHERLSRCGFPRQFANPDLSVGWELTGLEASLGPRSRSGFVLNLGLGRVR